MLKRGWAKLRTYLYYNPTERKGILVFAALLILFFIGFYVYEQQQPAKIDAAAFFARVDSIESSTLPSQETPSYFTFNPNTVDSNALQQLGFSAKQISTLQKYRKAGGHFYTKRDFKKLFFVTDSIYQRYEPYLFIPKSGRKPFGKRKELPQPPTQVKAPKDSLFNFNPNTLSKSKWELLGVSRKVAQVIENYLLKGGYFYKKEDLKKIYGLSEATYTKLAPYIKIPPKQKATPVRAVYDLNTITTEQLREISLSKSMAGKVIKYREKLGGYAQLSQLLEIYNMTERSWRLLQKHCKIQSTVTQININTAELEQLYRHPYLDFHDAEAILRYRKRKGDYKSIEILQSHKILTDKVFEKVRFYLKVKN